MTIRHDTNQHSGNHLEATRAPSQSRQRVQRARVEITPEVAMKDLPYAKSPLTAGQKSIINSMAPQYSLDASKFDTKADFLQLAIDNPRAYSGIKAVMTERFKHTNCACAICHEKNPAPHRKLDAEEKDMVKGRRGCFFVAPDKSRICCQKDVKYDVIPPKVNPPVTINPGKTVTPSTTTGTQVKARDFAGVDLVTAVGAGQLPVNGPIQDHCPTPDSSTSVETSRLRTPAEKGKSGPAIGVPFLDSVGQTVITGFCPPAYCPPKIVPGAGGVGVFPGRRK